MVKEIFLDDTPVHIDNYKEDIQEGLQRICVEFQVTSEEYHDITKLLYKGTFDIKVPEKDLSFKGTIQEYSTSITNLYEKGQVGDFRLCLRAIKSLV